MRKMLIKLSPLVASKYLYKKVTGKKLNLKNPRDFNEKIQWLKLYWQNPLVVKCADKYEVRFFVKERGCQEILNELYGVYNKTSEINWDLLPEKFVLKTTNGSGTNIICEDKKRLDKEKVYRKLEAWMKVDYGLKAAEIHYSKMTPRIIAEKYIETEAGKFPNDYKIFCFNGEPKLALVITERSKGGHSRFFFDAEWREVNITKDYNYNTETPKQPTCFNEMIEYSRKLSEGFPFVRVDFYDYNGKPLFGEMTFTPVGGWATYYKEDALLTMGDWITLPMKY